MKLDGKSSIYVYLSKTLVSHQDSCVVNEYLTKLTTEAIAFLP